MSDAPDLNFDIDALFEHLFGQSDQSPGEEEMDWVFTFESNDLDTLEDIGELLDEEFNVHLQENTEIFDLDSDDSYIGPPTMTVVHRGALTCDEVKTLVARFEELAEQYQIQYCGVDCYDPVDPEEVFGWLPAEDALWRLRHWTDSGMAENEELPWAFLVLAPSLDDRDEMLQSFQDRDYADYEVFEEPDDDGQYAVCLMMEGRNNEPELGSTIQSIVGIAEGHGGKLEGVQFYSREELEMLYGDPEEEE